MSSRYNLFKNIFLITGATSALTLGIIYQIHNYTTHVYTSTKNTVPLSTSASFKNIPSTNTETQEVSTEEKNPVPIPVPEKISVPVTPNNESEETIVIEPLKQPLETIEVSATPSIRNADRSTIQNLIFEKTNEARMLNGFTSLSLDSRLIEPAYSHSKDMGMNVYFAHEDISGCDIVCRITKVNYPFSVIGENIYYLGGFKLTNEALATRIVNGWMNSPHHRENILNPEFTKSAIGVFILDDKLYATALYSKPL